MRRRAERLERVVRMVLASVAALALAGFAIAGLSGRPDSAWLNLALLTPLLGGMLGLARLAALRPKWGRATLVYLLACLALLLWGGSGAWQLMAALRHGSAHPVPTLGDVGYYAGGLIWAIAVWVLYEGVVPDFLSEVEANSYLLSMLTLATLFVLSVAGGADLVASLKTGGNPVQLVALTFPLLYGFNALMLLRLGRRRQGARLLAGQDAVKLLAAGLGLVYLAQMTLETMVLLGARGAGSSAVVRPALLPAVGYALAFVVLTIGVARYPLATPVVDDRPPNPAAPCRP